jgi:hypothetical protein
VEPRLPAYVLPRIAAALVEVLMIGATELPATMSQFVVFPLQVLRMTMLPVVSTSIPRSLMEHVFPSMRLSLPVAWMPAPSLRPLPLELQLLRRTKLRKPTRIPSPPLPLTTQPSMVPVLPEMPTPALLLTLQREMAQPELAAMPPLWLLDTAQSVATLFEPKVKPRSWLKKAFVPVSVHPAPVAKPWPLLPVVTQSEKLQPP